MNDPYKERRRWPRYSVMVDCRIEGVSTRTVVRLTALSIGGGYVDATTSLQSGEAVALVMTLDGTELTVPARIIYTTAGRGFGFAFDRDEMPDASREQIEEFLRNREAGA